ncbi:PIG-L family deacetylase [Candidatus Woesearchaeota archaeon]|nr:PIG-L family deacetylase [Candidatus Woesearchaeota archaeon]
MKETIMAIAAHNDDHIIGAGGALAKYAKQGKRVRTIILSFGEKSHPYLKKEVIIEKRVKESLRADKLIGGAGIAYLGIREGKFEEDFKKKRIAQKLAQIIKQEKPKKIFTHGIDDLHPDHRATHKLIMKLIEKNKIKCPVYSFDVWSLFKLRQRNLPKLVVDISDTFNIKIKAFLKHQSQTVTIWAMLWKIIAKDLFSGIINGHTYAEVFYKIK